MLPPKGKPVCTSSFVDTNLMHDAIAGRSASGVLEMLNQTPVDWFSKRQNQVETAVHGSEFMVAWIGCERLIDLRHTLRSFGVPLDGPSWMFGDNKSVVTSSAVPHSRLSKRWNALSHHRVREAIAGRWLRFEHVPGMENPADILTEPLLWFTLKVHVELLLVWKGGAVDAPPGGPNPEGSDTDLGRGTSRVVSQSRMVMANHGCDSTDGTRCETPCENPSAGMPIPAALSNNQCGALRKEDDQFLRRLREQSQRNRAKARNLFFCETCVGLLS